MSLKVSPLVVRDSKARTALKSLGYYFEVLKPRETTLLTAIGAGSAVVAVGGHPPLARLLWVVLAVAIGSAGCNGLTNYLDRELDGSMQRTRHRALPSHHIQPAEKVLPVTIGLVVVALALAWWLHPYAFVAGVIGTLAAVIGRKTAFTHLLGGLSGSAPVVIGWLALAPASWELLILCVLIMSWVPIHVWSLMLAYRNDYLGAGVRIFPVTWKMSDAVKVLLALSTVLFAASLALYFVAQLRWIYLITAIILGLAMVFANGWLLKHLASKNAWRVYKLSAYPYLGFIFLAMSLDLWLL